MNPVELVRNYHAELTALRRDLHAHPELGFEEHRTAAAASRASSTRSGIEHHRGIGQDRRGRRDPRHEQASGRAIGLRADMDCLPMHEAERVRAQVAHEGRMHGCGHDGHTTMLLGAARYLARDAQLRRHRLPDLPAGEEGGGGGKAMVEDGLFERFPGRRGLRAAQLAGAAAGHRSPCARAR